MRIDLVKTYVCHYARFDSNSKSKYLQIVISQSVLHFIIVIISNLQSVCLFGISQREIVCYTIKTLTRVPGVWTWSRDEQIFLVVLMIQLTLQYIQSIFVVYVLIKKIKSVQSRFRFGLGLVLRFSFREYIRKKKPKVKPTFQKKKKSLLTCYKKKNDEKSILVVYD